MSQDQTAKATRSRNPEDTQRRLMAAGLSVFGRKGYGAATVSEIVANAGCSKGAFYCHFASKDELFLAILESRLQRNVERWLELYPWNGNCRVWVQGMIETMCGFAERDPTWRALAVEFMAHSMRDPRVGERLASMHRRFRQMVVDHLRQSEAYRSGQMIAEPELIALALGAIVDGIVIHCGIEPGQLPITQTVQRLRPLLAAWFPEE